MLQKQSPTISRPMPCQSQARSTLEKQLPSFIAEHDIIQYGIFPCSIQVSYASCVPSKSPAHPQLTYWQSEQQRGP